MNKYIVNKTRKHTYYNNNRLNKDLLKFIMVLYNKNNQLIETNIRLADVKWDKIQDKHSLICGEDLLIHANKNLPFYINKGFKERGLWRTKQDELIFISSDTGSNGERIMFAIIISSDLKFIFVKSFYDIYNMAVKEKTFNKKHKRFTEKGIIQILDFI